MLKDGITDFIQTLSDLVFPPACHFCDSPEVESGFEICADCAESITRIEPPICAQCGLPLAHNTTHEMLFCGTCLTDPPAYGTARFGTAYEGDLRQALKNFKYNGQLRLSSALGQLLSEAFFRYYDPAQFDVIVPVPIHRKKLLERGFNQAVILARKLSKNTGIPLDRNSFKKIRDTPAQARLSKKERQRNLKGSFQVSRLNAIKDKRILLVDDVATTGSTITEASRTLHKAGAAQVSVLVLALTLPGKSEPEGSTNAHSKR
ncbi:ComF family protein [Desulfomonile tiedjei]|uniref:Putative amidophosphoribosyltransferase n=1 Tax=Desulfomonile tiedjei (strain ATCC 49306 / DSM 6799 / DCB-1) TaxID=706587 RepID=I4C808_DESTA|nr:ComF family protein [Desulfomonile tiedjei]AFM25699.1 putative amidophosphoribosyltransferase [Desulfomonile tiedjei DSM 6799]